jgi:putative salt-induced outer membrane protein YdiY
MALRLSRRGLLRKTKRSDRLRAGQEGTPALNGFRQRLQGKAIRLFGTMTLGLTLLLAGTPVGALESTGLELGVRDVFPVTRADIGFTDDPETLQLAQASNQADARKAWEAALPPTDQFDWVQMTSGEWLKGELKVMYSGVLEFDSDEFDLQSLDWDDVAQVLGNGTERLSIETPEGLETVVGKLTVTRDTVIVETEEGVLEFERSQLVAIAPGVATEWDNWSFKITFGLGFLEGNTQQTDFTAKANIKRQTPENRFVIDYLGNYSTVSDQETVNNHRLNTFFDVFASRKYFWRPIFAEYYRDPFQNLDYRTTLGVGAGYHIIDTSKTTWDVSGGPAIRWTRYKSVQPGDSDKVETPGLVVGTFYDTELTKTVDFIGRYNLTVVNEESGKYTHHAIATFEIEITDIFDFDVSFVWDRTESPQPRADGTVPKQDDFQLLLTFGVDI